MSKEKNLPVILTDDSPIKMLLDKIFAAILALCPILQHYDCIIKDAGTVFMAVAFCYFGIQLLRAKRWHFGIVLPLVAMSLYEIVNHGTGVMEIAREALLIGYFVAAASGVVNFKYYVKAATCVAFSAGALLVVQYVCYYALGFHLQLVNTAWLDSGAEQWVLLAETGRISVTGKPMSFYRPSAFFLEPSHLTLYTFPLLGLSVLSPKMDLKRIIVASVLSLSIILSTSGMGIAIVFGFWGLYLVRHLMGDGDLRRRIKTLFRPKNLVWIFGLILIFGGLYAFFEPFRMSVNRIFSSANGKNAIEGRMGTGISAIKSLSGVEFWLGKSDWGNVHKWNMAGFFYTFYTQGFIGVLLSFGFYVYTLIKTKDAYFWLAFIVIGLSLITIHTHAAFYMMYYVMIMLGGHDLTKDKLYIPNFFIRKKADQ